MMQVVKTIEEVRNAVRAARKNDKIIGFVPTMGALHDGHLSLIKAAKKECGFVVASVFVNPTQFGPTEDFDKYPRPIEADVKKCQSAGVDVVFNPDVREMYPQFPQKLLTSVQVSEITGKLCGKSRPNFFGGVTLVVSKLFNIVQPDLAYFGQKDAQQALVIRRMVADLNFPLTVRVCPIVREASGLAMSSRNMYLSEAEKKQAVCLSKSLAEACRMIKAGEKKTARLISDMTTIIKEAGPCAIDYININDLETLAEVEIIEKPVLIALAVGIGPARLIDNRIVDAAGNEMVL
jgi:pantoate--beta-alanine ligase